MQDIIEHCLVAMPPAARSLLGVSMRLDDIICSCYATQEISVENIVLVAWARERSGHVVQYEQCPNWMSQIKQIKDIPTMTAKVLLLKDTDADVLWPILYWEHTNADKSFVHYAVLERLLVSTNYKFNMPDVMYALASLAYLDLRTMWWYQVKCNDAIAENIINIFHVLLKLDQFPKILKEYKMESKGLSVLKNQVDNLPLGRNRDILSILVEKMTTPESN